MPPVDHDGPKVHLGLGETVEERTRLAEAALFGCSDDDESAIFALHESADAVGARSEVAIHALERTEEPGHVAEDLGSEQAPGGLRERAGPEPRHRDGEAAG